MFESENQSSRVRMTWSADIECPSHRLTISHASNIRIACVGQPKFNFMNQPGSAGFVHLRLCVVLLISVELIAEKSVA